MRHQQSHLQILLLLACLVLSVRPCIRLVKWTLGHSTTSDIREQVHEATSSHFLLGRTRNLQIREMHSKVVQREREIKSIKKQLSHAQDIAADRDATIASAESILQVLQNRLQQEQAAHTEAELGLTQKSTDLEKCYLRKGSLGKQIDSCSDELDRIALAKTSHIEI